MSNFTKKESSWTPSIHDKRDWVPVTWDKRGEKVTGESEKMRLNKAIRSGMVTTSLRSSKTIDEIIARKKIENEEETFKYTTVSKTMSKKIAQARNEKKITQKDFANFLCIPQKMVQEYESGKAIPNHLVINKMEKFLGCKLRD